MGGRYNRTEERDDKEICLKFIAGDTCVGLLFFDTLLVVRPIVFPDLGE